MNKYKSPSHKSIALLLLVGMASCNMDRVPTPKPRAYPRVELPERKFEPLDTEDCPFTFEKPSYARFEQDTLYFDQAPLHPCWFDLRLEKINGSIHFSYYPVENKERLEHLISDAFKLSGKHNRKANYIDEKPFKLSNDVTGIVFELEGPVASPFQFFITDTTQHFLRGALYFDSKVNRDSIDPVYKFVRQDILHMIEGFQWK